MKTKKKHLKKVSRRRRLTLMAVQEKLGLFARQPARKGKQDHDYLKKKPLGLI